MGAAVRTNRQMASDKPDETAGIRFLRNALIEVSLMREADPANGVYPIVRTNRMTTFPCAICGEPESDHHAFTPIAVPPGCACDPYDWRDQNGIPPVCGVYVENPDGVCETCEHLAACHR